MAQRRMFNKVITNSDNFLDMPLSAQCLYFHLSMNADDDGFVNAPKTTLRMIGATADDYKILVAKNYVLEFETGVIVIRHWRLNNYLQKDRFTETSCKDEKALLTLDKNNVYTKCIQNVYTDKIRLDKNRLDKISIGKDIYMSSDDDDDEPKKTKINYQEIVDTYNTYCIDLPKVQKLSDARKKKIKTFLNNFSEEEFKAICLETNNSDFLSGRTGQWQASFDWLVNSTNATKVLEGNYKNKTATNSNNALNHNLELLRRL